MKGTNRIKLLSVFLIAAYLLSACSGAAPQSGSPVSGGKSQAKEVAFTGTVESVSAGEITVSGQVVAIDAKTVLDPNIKVGDIVKVEAQVSDTGAVTALKIESSGADDTTTDPGNANDTNTNADATNTNDNTTTGNDNINSNSNSNSNDNSNGAGGVEQEIVGEVEAISADSVTVGGVTYSFASFTEFKTPILVGDSVKLHLIVNADGTLTVREIEKTSGASIGDDNSNDNGNSNDDNGNDDNGNDDGDDDNSNSNSNDDNGNDDNSNGGSNSNGNSNGG